MSLRGALSKVEGQRSNPQGFTLIEVLLAVVFLAIGAIAVLRGYQSLLTLHERSRFVGEALPVLNERLAEEHEYILSDAARIGTWKGVEGNWEWATTVTELEEGGLYELEGTIRNKYEDPNRGFSVKTLVRR